MAKSTYNLPKRFLDKDPNAVTSMQVTWGFKIMLDRKRDKNETEEEALWRLIAHKALTQAEKKEYKEAGYEKYIT